MLVHADPDEYLIGFLFQHVGFEPQVEVVYFISADAGAKEFIIGCPVAGCQRVAQLCNVTAGEHTRFGDTVAKKDDSGGFDHAGKGKKQEGKKRTTRDT